LRFIHADKDRVIFQITEGYLDGAFVQASDHGMKIYNLPEESKSRKKLVEWIDLMIMNDALSTYDPEMGVHELGFVLELCEAVGTIFDGPSAYRKVIDK